ncbi:MAG: hypothetical protein WBQ94_29745 [Terracidiphilus sp.]
MRPLPGIFILAALAPALAAQQTQAPEVEMQGPGAPVVTMRDGGVSQTLQSIYIPPLPNAPFTAIVHTQWIRPLPEGGTYTLVNQRRVARDSRGRIYEERWLLVPKDGNLKSQMNVIQVADPSLHTLYNCFTLLQPHRCNLINFRDSSNAVYKPDVRPPGPLPNGAGNHTHEDLGSRTLAGVETTGTRDSTIINPGVNGNDRAYSITREFWYAETLGINLLSDLSNPNVGKQIFTVTDVSLSEPDPALFELPEGFEVVDRRQPSSPTE